MKQILTTITILGLIVFFYPNQSLAALPVAQDCGCTNTADSGSTSVTSITITNFVVNSGSDLVLILNSTAGAGAISDVTWNTTETFTKTYKYQRGFVTESWYLINPTAATANIVVNKASGATRISAVTFSGADQTTPTSMGGIKGEDGVTTLSITMTSTSTDSLIIDISSLNGGSGITHGASQTQISLIEPDSGSNPSHTDTYKEAASPGEFTMTEDHGTSGSIEILVFELKSAPAATVVPIVRGNIIFF